MKKNAKYQSTCITNKSLPVKVLVGMWTVKSDAWSVCVGKPDQLVHYYRHYGSGPFMLTSSIQRAQNRTHQIHSGQKLLHRCQNPFCTFHEQWRSWSTETCQNQKGQDVSDCHKLHVPQKCSTHMNSSFYYMWTDSTKHLSALFSYSMGQSDGITSTTAHSDGTSGCQC